MMLSKKKNNVVEIHFVSVVEQKIGTVLECT